MHKHTNNCFCNPDLRRLYGEDLGTEMVQRLQKCPNLARKIAIKNNDKSIEELTKYFKQIELEEEDCLQMKEYNFLKKLAETFRGPFKVTKVCTNGTALIKTKTI
jgi:hypothetical protein